MMMKDKERKLLRELHRGDVEATKRFRRAYEHLIKWDLKKQFEEVDKVSSARFVAVPVQRVIEYFLEMARTTDLSGSILTIEQMLHIAVVDLFIMESAGGFILDPVERSSHRYGRRIF